MRTSSDAKLRGKKPDSKKQKIGNVTIAVAEAPFIS